MEELKKKFEKQFRTFNAWTNDAEHPSQHYSRDDIWEFIEKNFVPLDWRIIYEKEKTRIDRSESEGQC